MRTQLEKVNNELHAALKEKMQLEKLVINFV